MTQHQELSGKKLQYFDHELGEKDANGRPKGENYIPYVVETSIGCDRMFLAMISNALQKETVESGGKSREREVLKLHPALAPVKCAILPLKKNDERLVNLAKEITRNLSLSFNVQYDDTGSIGKLYARQDAIGTPFSVCVDFEALDDNTVTIRDRDTLSQERVAIADLESIIRERVDMKQLFA